MRALLAVIFFLAVIVFGIWIDVAWFLVGGIEQIAHAVQAHPMNVGSLAWGIVRVLCSGITATVAIIIAVLGSRVIAGD